ncbi:MAG: response regulator transcription factor [Sphingomonadales bacterium]|nr:response regulator transcription factor [Sphingomonadales bacterium]MBD3771951.1 response regulator transcription factor [Paracoccaceae bacterium]
MTPMSVLVVDDEPLARRRLTRLLAKLDWVGRVEEAGDVTQACDRALQHRPDILLLDIQMPGGSGFEVLERLADAPVAVVFVTAFAHHALRAFEANAVDYVTKPIDPARFEVAMLRARDAASSTMQDDRIAELQETVASLKQALYVEDRGTHDFWVRSQGEYIRIAADSILRFQAERDYVRIHVAGADYLYQETLTSLEARLDSHDFIRIHRGTIVRRGAIARIKPAPFGALIVVLSDDSEVRIGRTYTSTIKSRLIS